MPPPATPVQGLTIHYIPIEDFQAPTLNQIEKFLEICDDALEAGKGVAVHCRGGNGRTGTVSFIFVVMLMVVVVEMVIISIMLMITMVEEDKST